MQPTQFSPGAWWRGPAPTDLRLSGCCRPAFPSSPAQASRCPAPPPTCPHPHAAPAGSGMSSGTRLPHSSGSPHPARPAPPGHAQPLRCGRQAWLLGAPQGLGCRSRGHPNPGLTGHPFCQPHRHSTWMDPSQKQPMTPPRGSAASGGGLSSLALRGCRHLSASRPLHQGQQHPPRGLHPSPASPWVLSPGHPLTKHCTHSTFSSLAPRPTFS